MQLRLSNDILKRLNFNFGAGGVPGDCTDHVVGSILSGWRYDISSLNPEMRKDYEGHFAECAYCRGRQRLHRSIDVLLILLATCSALIFLLAFTLIHRLAAAGHTHSLLLHFHGIDIALSLQLFAIFGLLASIALWVLVAISTPAAQTITDYALEKLPEEVRQRMPKISA
jgi:hypothetical protein